jgi:Holliday junction resolvase RusA-like endonuclease
MSCGGWQFEVRGTPAPQGSKRGFVSKGGRVHVVEQQDARIKSWREAVRAEAQRAIGGDDSLSGPVIVYARFYLPRPKSHYRTGRRAHELRPDAPTWVAKSPDLDKLLRSTLDALTDAGAWLDDRQVAEVTASKAYRVTPGATITIAPLFEHYVALSAELLASDAQ